MKRRALATLGAVLAVGAVSVPAVPAVAAPSPAEDPRQDPIKKWNVQQIWDSGAKGQGIVIAEIDTGVNADLGILSGKVLPGKDFGSLGGDGRTDRDAQAFGHGTSMASVMVGAPGPADIAGLAPDAKILPIALPLSGTTDASSDDHLSAAIKYAADHGAKIISMSLGGTRSPENDDRACRADEQAAVNYALRKGAIVTASAGNRGPGAASGQNDNAVESPAVCLGVVAVSAVDEKDKIASWSSRHAYVTFAAPGTGIATVSRTGVAYIGRGTSQANAIATGALALIWSKFPKLTGRQVLARVLATLDDKPGKHRDDIGYGLLDVSAAATAEVPADAPDPIYAAADPFLSRESAEAARKVTVPKPAKLAATPPGKVKIGNASRLLVGRVVTGLILGGVGLCCVLALAVAGISRRRRTGAPAEVADEEHRRPRPGPTVDADGAVWHEIHVAEDTSALRPVDEPSPGS